MNRFRAAQQNLCREIRILKRELKHINRAISHFERLEAGTPAKGKPFAPTKRRGTLVRMKRKSRLFSDAFKLGTPSGSDP